MGESEESSASTGATSGKAELKVSIAEVDIVRARTVLNLLNVNSQVRNITFYDTPTLSLFEGGVIMRARKIDGDDDDSTVKLRPFTLGQLDPPFVANDDVKCEIDRDPDDETSACSLKVDIAEGAIAGVAASGDIRTLFDSAQEGMLASYGPAVTWPEIIPLGPLLARVWEIDTAEVRETVTAELWYMPDGTQTLELSTKVTGAEADDGMDELIKFVADRGLALDVTQESKTRSALQAFAPVPVP